MNNIIIKQIIIAVIPIIEIIIIILLYCNALMSGSLNL